MKALKQVLFVKDASKAADWLPKMDQKLLGRPAAAGIHAGAAPAAGAPTYVDLDRDGEEVTEPEQVVEVFRQHYETLANP
jgi:hypothetical protein